MTRRSVLLVAIFSIIVCLCVGCTHVELTSKADAYDAAIWDANNRQILLNAVRASQRAPMSFVGFGDVTASPTFSGSTAGTFNLVPSALTGYSLNPSISYGGGFSAFQIGNLNQKDFAIAMHTPLTPSKTKPFSDEKWPKEVADIVLIQSISLSPAESVEIDRRKEEICRTSVERRDREICAQLSLDKDASESAACPKPVSPLFYLNSAREFCTMNRFQTLLRTLRLTHIKPLTGRYRSPEGIIYFLGELIAAQHYSAQRYTPQVLLYAPDGQHHLMKLFVVERGNPGPPIASVQVSFNGEDFYIPKPQLGAIDEDRSLQVLDMASTAILFATEQKSLPKSTSVNLISAK